MKRTFALAAKSSYFSANRRLMGSRKHLRYPIGTGQWRSDVMGGPGHTLANWDSCPTPAKSEAIEYLQVGPTEIRHSIAWTIFVYL